MDPESVVPDVCGISPAFVVWPLTRREFAFVSSHDSAMSEGQWVLCVWKINLKLNARESDDFEVNSSRILKERERDISVYGKKFY